MLSGLLKVSLLLNFSFKRHCPGYRADHGLTGHGSNGLLFSDGQWVTGQNHWPIDTL